VQPERNDFFAKAATADPAAAAAVQDAGGFFENLARKLEIPVAAP
jgi:hypothetical protein